MENKAKKPEVEVFQLFVGARFHDLNEPKIWGNGENQTKYVLVRSSPNVCYAKDGFGNVFVFDPMKKVYPL